MGLKGFFFVLGTKEREEVSKNRRGKVATGKFHGVGVRRRSRRGHARKEQDPENCGNTNLCQQVTCGGYQGGFWEEEAGVGWFAVVFIATLIYNTVGHGVHEVVQWFVFGLLGVSASG